MNPITREQLLTQLNWRYATKRFNPEHRISPEDWATLEQALVLTPSSFGLQPWRFVVVSDPSTRARLVGASWGQTQVAEASHLVVFAIKKHFDEQDIDAHLHHVAGVRGMDFRSLTELRDMMVEELIQSRDDDGRRRWATNQTYIALGNFLTSAAMLGVDVCPMEGIDQSQYDEILALHQRGLTSVVAAPAGYRAAGDRYAGLKKVRFNRENVLVAV